MCSSPACCVCTRLFALEVTGNNFVDYGLFESETSSLVVRTSSQVVSKFLGNTMAVAACRDHLLLVQLGATAAPPATSGNPVDRHTIPPQRAN